MNKKLWWGISVAVIVSVLIFVKADEGSDNRHVIKIGFIAPLSGNVAFLGEGVRNAALLALEDLKAKETDFEYELVFEDDGFNPVKAASAARKLISVDGADVLVTVASSAGNAVSPIAEEEGVVHIAIAGDQNIAKGDFNFLNWTPPVEEVKTFISEAQKRGIRTLGVFTQAMPGTIAVVDELERQIVGTGIEIVFKDVSNFGTKDFRAAIRKVAAAKPDYVMFMMFSPELELVVKQMQELGVELPLTAIESFELSDDPGLFEDLWYVNAADPTEVFARAYQNRYSKAPSIATPNAYDIVGLVAAAVEGAGGKEKPTSTELAKALSGIRDFSGALGEGLYVDPSGLVVSKAVVRMIKDGKPVTIGE